MMAMDGNKLGQEITAAIVDGAAPPIIQAQVLTLWQKIGGAIVKHIQDNAEVPAGIPVTTNGGPTSQTGSTTDPGAVK
jgi:hypothetical protein